MVSEQLKEEVEGPGPTKNPLVFVASLVSLIVVLAMIVLPWLAGNRSTGRSFIVLALLSAAGWSIILLWGFYESGMQLASLVDSVGATRSPRIISPSASLRFLILYVTCDDFLSPCCLSCVKQDYPEDVFRVAVCDDSKDPTYQSRAQAFCDLHGAVYIRRINGAGYKAGNLNNAFKVMGPHNYDWVVVADADQWLPQDYLRRLASSSATLGSEIAFVQTGRDQFSDDTSPTISNQGRGENTFQRTLAPEILIFFERVMCPRYKFGFFPFLGHGAAVRSSTWEAVGGFPHRVSEDYAFSMRLCSMGFGGARIDTIRCGEMYPPDFGAFVVRLSKFAAGAAQLIRLDLWRFLNSRASLTEKVDAAFFLGSYSLAPLFLFNLFLSSYICHWAWKAYVPVLAPELAYLFVAMYLCTISIMVSATPSTWRGLRYWFWAFAVYSAALPSTAVAFVSFLFKNPTFRRTPKSVQASPPLIKESVIGGLLGVAGLAVSILWWSPFSFVVAATSLAMTSFALYRWLDRRGSLWGRVARALVYVPGLLYIVGMGSMWWWATM